jgi:type I restriction enzyme S subunit
VKNIKFIPLSATLDKIIDYRGKTPKKLSGQWSNSGYRAISALNVKSDGLHKIDQIRFVDHALYKKWMREEISRGDILLTSEAPAGQVLYWDSDEKIVLSQRLFALRTKINFDARYLSYYLRSDVGQKAIFNKVTGSTVFGISAKMFDLIPVINLDLPTQQKVASILYALESKIELNNKINIELEVMAKLIYDYWFVQFDFPDENGKPYKSSGGKMVWSDELKRDIPEKWKAIKLGQFINVYDSQRVPISKRDRSLRKGKYPYYGATSIMDYIDEFIFDGEYILLAEDGSVMNDKGFPNLQFVSGKFWVNNHAHVLQAKESSSNEFLYRILEGMPVVRMMTGSVQMKVNQENLLKTKVMMPDQNSLKSYTSVCSSLRKIVFHNDLENQKLSKLRDWLLPMLMNGQVSVSE